MKDFIFGAIAIILLWFAFATPNEVGTYFGKLVHAYTLAVNAK